MSSYKKLPRTPQRSFNTRDPILNPLNTSAELDEYTVEDVNLISAIEEKFRGDEANVTNVVSRAIQGVWHIYLPFLPVLTLPQVYVDDISSAEAAG